MTQLRHDNRQDSVEWRDLVRAGRVSLRTLPDGNPVQLVEKQAVVRAFDLDSRIVEVVASDGSVDRMNDTIDPEGWTVGNYQRNPVVLIDHDYSVASIVGRSLGTKLMDGQFIQRQQLDDPKNNESAAMVLNRLDSGSLSAVSVGFMPLVWRRREDDEGDMLDGFAFLQQDLLEVSWVAVPANPNAVVGASASAGERQGRDQVDDETRAREQLYARLMVGGLN